MFTRLFRLLLTLLVVGALIWFFAPRVLDGAANSLISSTVSKAQGLAQYVPAGINSPNLTKGDLQINMTGLTPRTPYQVTLDEGQCGQTNVALGTALSDANGALYKEYPLPSLDTKKTWFISLWQQSQNVACGQLQTNLDTGAQVVNAAQNGPDVFGPQPSDTSQNQNATPTDNSQSTNTPIVNGFPNTGAGPASHQQYDNNQYPRKY
ncbi:MAG TPA: hypothetical protein VGD98_19545 [Ktedonobacteraceae bacterium]